MKIKSTLAALGCAMLTTTAMAADLPSRKAPPPYIPPPPVFTWTGFYAGLESAYTFTDRERGPVLVGWADEEEVPALAGGIAGHVYEVRNRTGFSDQTVDERSLTLRVEDR